MIAIPLSLSHRHESLFYLFIHYLFYFSLGHSHVTQMRWCTIKALEQQKCQDFVSALKNVSSELNITLQASCVQGSNAIDCMQKIKDGQADLITLDGGEIYEAGIATLVYFVEKHQNVFSNIEFEANSVHSHAGNCENCVPPSLVE